VSKPSIEVHGLSRSFGSTVAVDGLDFAVNAGEVVALLGPNGAGKTTTVRVLNGVLRPDAGYSRVLGIDPATNGAAVRRRSGVLTENSGLDDRLTAVENVVSYARIRGLARSDAEPSARRMLEQFGMADRADKLVQGMSTGQRKRVALARSLLHRPEVLFLDEPTSGLDPAATREVIDLMATLAREEGRTILLCTHFLTEASRLCRKVAILERGRLISFGRPEELAAELWPGIGVRLDLGAPLDERAADALRALRGVLSVEPHDGGAAVQLDGREALPPLVAALVTREITVYGVVPATPGLEDVYFALTGRRGWNDLDGSGG
jgi:ABC-2 type transport system ATP-binding protein